MQIRNGLDLIVLFSSGKLPFVRRSYLYDAYVAMKVLKVFGECGCSLQSKLSFAEIKILITTKKTKRTKSKKLYITILRVLRDFKNRIF